MFPHCVDILLVCGELSKYVVDTVTLHRQLAPGVASIIRLEDVAEPLQETQAKTAEAVLLFCQVITEHSVLKL